jgi:hypothetical protein
MKQKPNSKHKLFNLDEDAIKHIQEGSRLNNMNQSEFIELLANQWEYSIDPTKKLKHLQSEKVILKNKIIELEKQESQIIEILQLKDEWNNRKQKELPRIVRNIVRVIQEGRNIEAETMAKNQGIRFGIPAIEILTKATDIIKNGQ